MPIFRDIYERLRCHIGTQHSGVILILHIVERILLCVELTDRLLRLLR